VIGAAKRLASRGRTTKPVSYLVSPLLVDDAHLIWLQRRVVVKHLGEQVFKTAYPVAGCITLTVVATLVARIALAKDDFPLTGNYTQNVPCKGDGSDPADSKLTISPREIVANLGVCTILDTKRDGDSISAQVECRLASGLLVGDITFTPHPDNTVEFHDRDMNYKAILYRCRN
jgi:hypothetical protein